MSRICRPKALLIPFWQTKACYGWNMSPKRPSPNLERANVKELLIMRHADAADKSAECKDFDRPLSDTGKMQAARIADILAEAGAQPELIVASAALRARETVEIFMQRSGLLADVILTKELYSADGSQYLVCLGSSGGVFQRVMIVGHNPSVEETVGLLLARSMKLPTAGVVRLALDINEWSEIVATTSARLLSFLHP
jgi:phosphohistidine phosphatase